MFHFICIGHVPGRALYGLVVVHHSSRHPTGAAQSFKQGLHFTSVQLVYCQSRRGGQFRRKVTEGNAINFSTGAMK